jgi:uncharacterized protein (TIGR00645 family)
MEDLTALRKSLVRDGKLSDNDVECLRQKLLHDDGGITMEKGNLLFELKDTVSKKNLSARFSDLFVDAICALLLEDEDSPGEIDNKEAKWVRARIQAKGYMDRYDKRLLKALRKRSINFPEILNYKSEITRRFEYTLYFTRFLTLLAVFGSLFAAIALFIKGAVIVVDGMIEFVTHITSPEYEHLLEMFVSSVDVFLFAMVLIIFGVGIYELFISKIDPVEKKADNRPTWMQVSNVDDLKASLGKVILMVLIVTFFKYSIEVEYGNVNDLLKLGVGIILIAGALFITNKSHHHG